MPGLLSLASLLSGFNGGASQVAPWFLGGSGDFPFINLLKTSGNWGYSNNQGIPTPDTLNSDGYPLVIPAGSGGIKTLVSVFPPAIRTGTYVMTWDGNGTISLQGSTLTSGSLTSTTGSGRVEFTINSVPNAGFVIASLSTPIITNIQFFLKADEAALDAGQVFGTQFLSVLRSGNPGVLRFLDWGNYNTTNATTWSTRKPSTYFSYGVNDYRSALYAGAATNNVFKFAATLGTGAPVDKQTLHVQFQPSTVSVSVNATAAVCTWNSHGLNVGTAFLFDGIFGVVLPTDITNVPNAALVQSSAAGSRQVYWVTNVIDANNFNFSRTKGGANIATSGSQTGTPSAFPYPTSQSVTVTAANPGVVTWANHGLNIGDALALSTTGNWGSTGLWGSRIFYVSATGFTTGSFQFSLTPGGSSLNTTGVTGTFTACPVQTFNLNGTGDVPLLSPYGDPISGSLSAFCSAVPLLIATLVYDADIGGWLKFGSDSGGASGLATGVPPEVCLQLCTAIGAHPHFPSPFLAVDPMTDWHTQLATYIKTNGPTWMKPRFEGTNETWNFANGFYATRYAWNKSPRHWGSTTWQSQDNWYGKIMSTIGQSVNAVYGGTPSTTTAYAVMCGVMTTSAQINGIFPGAGNVRLNSNLYVNQSASAQSGYIKDPAYNWVSHTCMANYWSPGETGTPQEIADAFNFTVTNITNPTNQTTVATNYLNTSNSGCLFTGSLSLGVMTVTAISRGSGNILPGSVVFNQPNSVVNTNVLSQLTGTTGGIGTYSVSGTQVISSGGLYTTGSVNGAAGNAAQLAGVYRLATQLMSWQLLQSGGLVTKMCGYEGGYSPDYPSGSDSVFNSTITGVTNDNTGAVVTLSNYAGNATGTGSSGCVVGMPILISSVGGMTQLNTASGKSVTITAGTPGTVTYTAHGFTSGQPVFFEPNNLSLSSLPGGINFGQSYYVATVIDANTFSVSATNGGSAIAMTGVQGNSVNCNPCWVVTSIPSATTVKLNVDSSGFSTYTSGGTFTYGCSVYIIIELRQGAKFVPVMQTLTTQMYNDFVSAGGEFPSCYVLAGGNAVWPVWDPNIFNASIPPQWAAITAFNT